MVFCQFQENKYASYVEMVENKFPIGPKHVPMWIQACQGEIHPNKIEMANQMLGYWFLNRRMKKPNAKTGCMYHQPSS